MNVDALRVTFLALLLAMAGGGSSPVHADQKGFGGFPSTANSAFGVPSGLNGGLTDSNPSGWTAEYHSTGGGVAGQGVLEVQAVLADSWHVYSVTQPKGGPRRTKITIESPKSAAVAGPFTPDFEPSKSESSVYQGVTIEEHSEEVLWSAPIAIPNGFTGEITVKISALVCKSGDGRCLPVDQTIVAKFAGPISGEAAEANPDKAPQTLVAQEAATAGPLTPVFRDDNYVVQWTAQLKPATVSPGGHAVLHFTATPNATFHIYEAVTDDSEASTNFVVTQKSGLKLGKPQADKPVISHLIVPSQPPVKYYNGKVTWSLPIQIPADAAPGMKPIEGLIAYQACTDNSCHKPMALKFVANVLIGEPSANSQANSQAGIITLASSKFATAMDAAGETPWVDKGVQVQDVSTAPAKSPTKSIAQTMDSTRDSTAPVVAPLKPVTASTGSTSYPVVLVLALLGGFVLNFMPCVLPVIGLKVMSFVSQGGQDRKRILSLNLAYVGGIFAVFALLAVLAIGFSFSWGQQFQYFPVRLGVTVGLFAFALSYFNVWEIPVPGMAAGETSQKLQSQEGYGGAFSKGIFTTLLATPCSGPLLGGVFGATIGMAPAKTAMVFAMLALGMSFPYLLIGAKPELAKHLPKPGPWMETFKQLMAFLFLGAVAYFFYQFADENKFPVFVCLMGVWFGCWIIGLVPGWATLQKRMVAWTAGLGVAVAIGILAFTVLKAPPILQWVDYDEAALTQYQAEGKTVLVDFSAKWCPNCLLNLKVAIDTDRTRRLVDKNNVVAMYADWTNDNPEITAKLEELQSNSIPVLAIYPAGRSDQPIILRDLVSQNAVLEALKQAGPSLGEAAVGRDMSRDMSRDKGRDMSRDKGSAVPASYIPASQQISKVSSAAAMDAPRL